MVIDRKKQNVFLIIQSLLCVLLALLLAGAVICLYQEGVSLKAEDPSAWIFTREAVAERLRPVLPVLILTIAVHSSIVAAIDPAERVAQAALDQQKESCGWYLLWVWTDPERDFLYGQSPLGVVQ